MNKYSVLWVLENPATGSMWETDYAKETFKFVHKVDYCAYGSIIQKETKFAFSREDVFTLFKPKECEGRAKCVACFRDPSSGYLGHMDWEKVKYKKRISIPDQLCVSIIYALLSPIKTVTNELQTTLSELIATPASSSSRHSPQITSNIENTPRRIVGASRSNDNVIGLNTFNNRSERIAPTTLHRNTPPQQPYKKHKGNDYELDKGIKWDIVASNVVIFASNDPYLKTTNINITSTEHQLDSHYAMAIYITQESPLPVPSIKIDGRDYYVMKGRRYIGICDGMTLQHSIDVFIIPNEHILTVYTLSEHDDYLSFKITKAKKKHIINMLQKIDNIS